MIEKIERLKLPHGLEITLVQDTDVPDGEIQFWEDGECIAKIIKICSGIVINPSKNS